MTSCTEICGSDYTDPAQAPGHCQQYGVRSYYISFMKNVQLRFGNVMKIFRFRDRQAGGALYSGSICLCQVCLAFGALVLFAGFVVVLVGYATPARIEAFGEDDLLFVDSQAVSFNQALDVCKLTGAILFCVGGTSMAVGLLLSAFAKGYSKEELYLQQKFKERLADLQATVGTPIMRAPTPGEGKVPVTLSKVQNIQPSNAKSET
ncbi:hypothetical protein WMY93_026820 [Mugilogobius chulae]|uniref:Neurensin 1 n=1 Tax=Mugilogobius chulae TaxID=88201 RepID=A0AAW0N053_9GOBI